MSKPKVHVKVESYTEFCSGSPNNYRVEIEIAGHPFVYDGRRGEHGGHMSKDKAEKIAQEVLNALGTKTCLETRTNYGVLDARQRNALIASGKKLLRLRGDVYVDDTRSPADDYCWECGHEAPREEFTKENKCPNPKCLRPENWNS